MGNSMDAAMEQKERRRQRFSMRKLVKWLLVIVLLVAAGIVGGRYWLHSQRYVSTDNAYLNANTVEIAAQISGPVIRVYVKDNQAVNSGDSLFDIDPRPYQLALEKAQAQLHLAGQSVSQQSAAVAAAQAQVAQRAAELKNAQSNNARTQRLVKQGFLSEQGSEAARTQAATAAAALRAAQANLEQARSALGETGEANAGVQAAQAAVDQAKLDLQRTHVSAPTQGVVANLSLRPGNTVQPGVPLFSIISSQEYWADANFKETGNRAGTDPSRPAGDDHGRYVSGSSVSRRGRKRERRQRHRVFIAAAAERHRQLGESDATGAGAGALHQSRSELSAAHRHHRDGGNFGRARIALTQELLPCFKRYCFATTARSKAATR